MIRGASAFLAVAVVLMISACKEKDISGIYIHSFESGVYAHNQEPCEAPHRIAEGTADYCYEPIEVSNALGLKSLENGEMQFAIRLVFFNWHSCSLRGVAQKDRDTWVYRDDRYHEDCVLRIRHDENSILLNTDEGATCNAYCGARGQFNDARFDLDTLVKKQVSLQDIDCIIKEGDVETEQCEK